MSHEVSRLAVDSTVSVETWQTPVKVPMSAVSLTLPVDSLRLLPPEAAYTARQGRASVKVRRTPPTATEPERILIEAGCDSLELVAASYSKTTAKLSRQLKEANKQNSALKETSKEHSSNGIRTVFIAFIVGVATGIVITKFNKIKKLWQNIK